MIILINSLLDNYLEPVICFLTENGITITDHSSFSTNISNLAVSGLDEFYIYSEKGSIKGIFHLRTRINLDHFSSYTEIMNIIVHPSSGGNIIAEIIEFIVDLARSRDACGIWVECPDMDKRTIELTYYQHDIMIYGIHFEKILNSDCLSEKGEDRNGTAIILREAGENDADALSSLMQYIDTPGINKNDLVLQMRKVREIGVDEFFVCDSAGEVVGLCHCRDRYDLLKNEFIGEVVLLSTDLSWRDRGIGGILLHHGERLALNNNCRRLWICSGSDLKEKNAHPFYYKHGYSQIGYKLERRF